MANLFIRTYTFVDGTTAYGSQIETEFENLSVTLNNLNTGTATWGIVSISNANSVPLVADCASGSQDIADFKNNNVTKVAISSAGGITAQGAVTSTPTSNQLILGTTRTITLSATQPASASRTYTFPDMGAASNVLMSATALVDNMRVNAAGYIIGTIIQRVQFVDTSTSTSSGTGYTSTTTTASITPKATTHLIKISVTGNLFASITVSTSYASIFRGSTDLSSSGNGFMGISGSAAQTITVPCSAIYLDNPATTSSITYTVKIKSSTSGDAVWNGVAGGHQDAVILLEEIVA